jgi:hypothetical protein
MFVGVLRRFLDEPCGRLGVSIKLGDKRTDGVRGGETYDQRTG